MDVKMTNDGHVIIDTTNYMGGNCHVNILALTTAGGTSFLNIMSINDKESKN